MIETPAGLVECVMNVSEGRRAPVVASVAAQLEAAGALVLGVSSDADHNRSVLTFVGFPPLVEEAAFQAIRTAVALIDLRQHEGVHPRIGAVDVVPFVPLRGVEMRDCVDIARSLAARVAAGLAVPVYLYGEAALRRDRTELPDIRKGGLEGLSAKIGRDPYRFPDFGPKHIHPSAGATVIGARPLLIAFNVFLDTDDPAVARRVASRVREKDGGLPGVRALGFFLPLRGRAQVSINLCDYRVTSLLQVWERVRLESARLGAEAVSSEVIGLAPEEAFPANPAETLHLEGFHEGLVLESRIVRVLKERRAAPPGLKSSVNGVTV